MDDRSYEELEAAGICECGTPLDDHPPLRKPRPLASWKAQRTSQMALMSRTGRTLRDEDEIGRRSIA